MGFWFSLFLFAATFVLQDYFRQRLPAREPSGEGDFNVPTSTQGRPIPQPLAGTVRVSPNVLWYGDWQAEPVTVETGIIFKRDETVGYNYRIGMALGFFIGESAGVTGIWVGDDKVWDYIQDGDGNPAQDFIDVEPEALFGGENSGGTFKARFRVFRGTDDQPQSAYLADANRVGPDQSHWPGVNYVVMTNSPEFTFDPDTGEKTVPTMIPETVGARIGESNQLRDIRIEWQMHDTLARGGLGNILSLSGDTHFIGRDGNPIVAAYKVLTDPDWSVSTGEVNVVQFQQVAQVIYDEGIGYSQNIDSEQEAFEVLAEIEKHIDGYIGPNPVTGQIEIILARQDYDPETIFQIDDSNLAAIRDYAKPDWTQTKNDVSVRFVNRAEDYSDDHARAFDMANRAITNKPSPMIIRYPGCRDATVANILVSRTARTYFWPLAKFTAEIDRTNDSELLRPGDVARVNTNKIDAANNLAVRIIRVRSGDGVAQRILLDVVEDVFQTELGLLAAPPGTDITLPSSNPVDVAQILATPADINLQRNTLGLLAQERLLMFVSRDLPNDAALIRWQWRSAFGSGSFQPAQTETFPGFSIIGTLRSDLAQVTSDTTNNSGAGNRADFQIDGFDPIVQGDYNIYGSGAENDAGEGFMIINPGAANEEWVAVREIRQDLGGVDCSFVVRGLGATPISAHTAGEPVVWLDSAYLAPAVDGFDDGAGFQLKAAGSAYGNAQDLDSIAFGAEQEYRAKLPGAPPPTYLLCTDVSTSTAFPDGPWPMDTSQAVNFPSSEPRMNLTVYSRLTSGRSAHEADSRNRGGSPLPSDAFTEIDLFYNLRIYDLDATPNPSIGDEVYLENIDAGNGRTTAIDILRSTWQSIFPDGGLVNARIGLTQIYTNAGTGFTQDGVEGAELAVDRTVDVIPEQSSRGAFEETIVYLRGDGNDRTESPIIDHGPNDLTVTAVPGTGVAEINTGGEDDSLSAGYLRLEGDGRVDVTHDAVFNDLDVNDGYTIQFRIRFPSSAPAEGSVICPVFNKGLTGTSDAQIACVINGDNLQLLVSTNGTTYTTETNDDNGWSAGQWYDIALNVGRYAGVNRTYYFRDGSSIIDSHGSGLTPFDGTADLSLGAQPGGNDLPFPIEIDEFRIVKRGLASGPTPAPTTDFPGRALVKPVHYNFDAGPAAAQTYQSEDLNRRTLEAYQTSQISDASSQFGGFSLEVNGGGSGSPNTASNYDGAVILGSEDDTPFRDRDFVIEGWVRFDTLPSVAGRSMALVSKYARNLVTPWGDFYLGVVNTSGEDRLQITMNSNSTTSFNFSPRIESADLNPSTGIFYHFALVRVGQALALLWNGDRVAYDATFFDTYPTLADFGNLSDAQIALGRLRGNSGSGVSSVWVLDGFLDEVRIQIEPDTNPYDITQTTYTVPAAAFPFDPRYGETPPPPTAPAVINNFTPSAL